MAKPAVMMFEPVGQATDSERERKREWEKAKSQGKPQEMVKSLDHDEEMWYG